jgi:hypothetical protein
MKGTQVCLTKGPGLLQRGENHKNVKKKKINRVGSFENLKNYSAREAEIYMEVF